MRLPNEYIIDISQCDYKSDVVGEVMRTIYGVTTYDHMGDPGDYILITLYFTGNHLYLAKPTAYELPIIPYDKWV